MSDVKYEYSDFDKIKCAGIMYEYDNSKITKIIYLGTNQKAIDVTKGISIIKFEEIKNNI